MKTDEELKEMEFEKVCQKYLKDKDLNDLLTWHEKYEGEVYCPFCGVCSDKVKTNGEGFYRCKGKCENSFFLLRNNEKLGELK